MAPHASLYRQLNPIDRMGWVHVGLNLAIFVAGVLLAASGGGLLTYLAGQVLLAVGFAQSFVILHEAGHRTMFCNRNMNDFVGVLSGFCAMIPYATWLPVHNRHHRFTGWQDLDATTESLTPRELSGFEKGAINVAWRFWLPLFSIIYRVQNYWRVARIAPFLPDKVDQRRLKLMILLQLAGYGLLIWYVGFGQLLFLIGPGLFLSLMGQDLLILSQHTGMPTNLSHGHHVDPFPPSHQEEFTRSVRLPQWLSWMLLHFDAHELHHLYPAVPGYRLRQIEYDPPNEVNMIRWVREVKALSGTQFLFGKADGVRQSS